MTTPAWHARGGHRGFRPRWTDHPRLPYHGNAPEVCQRCALVGGTAPAGSPRSSRGQPAAGVPVPTHSPSGALDHMTSTQVRPSSTPQIAVNDIGTAEDFLAAIDQTIKYFNDVDIVEGVIVKVDRDEVLLDIGYKTEGVIPSRELSIKHDVDPNEVVKVGDEVEAL